MKKLVFITVAVVVFLALSCLTLTAADGGKNVIQLYDGENKCLMGTLSYSEYLKMESYGGIIEHLSYEFTSNGVVFKVDGAHKIVASDEDGTFNKIFAGWYIELPIKIFTSNWNWDIENSICGRELFDSQGNPNPLFYNSKNDCYRIFAYWITENYAKTVVSYSDKTADDGYIENIYFNYAIPNDVMFERTGFVLSDKSEASDTDMRIGGNPLLVIEADAFDSVIQSACYDFPITAKVLMESDTNGFKDEGQVVSLYLQGISAYKSLSVRSFWETQDGTIVYGPITTIELKDCGESLPVKK